MPLEHGEDHLLPCMPQGSLPVAVGMMVGRKRMKEDGMMDRSLK